MASEHKKKSRNLNLDDAKARFSKALNFALLQKFGRIPTANALANQFNFRAEGMAGVTRETARKWLAGQAFPEVGKLIVLVDWLGLDANAFMSTRPTNTNMEEDIVIDTISELLSQMDEKTRSMVLITAWALRETQGLQAHKLDLPMLRRALILKIGSN